VQLIFRLELRELEVVVASFLQFSRLRITVGKEFVDFGEMSAFSGLVEQIEQHFKGGRIFAHRADDGMQIF
jgi:hypothetical protein